MLTLVGKRILFGIVAMFGLVTLMFVIAHVAPGDPVTAVISPTIPTSVAVVLRRQFGMDQPLIVQYAHWLRNTLSGNLGISFRFQQPVVDVIASFFPNTLVLTVTAIVLETFVGIMVGMIPSRTKNSFIDKWMAHSTMVVYTMPTFLVALLLTQVCSYKLGLFPSSLMYSIGAEAFSPMARLGDLGRHLVLPASALAIPGVASIARYVRSSLLIVRREEHVTFARSLGYSTRDTFMKCELPHALMPVITLIGLEIGTLLTGAIVTETIFAWPGIGRLTMMAIFSRDYPLILGCTLVAGVVVIVGNLLADLLYAVVDPRVRGT